MLKRESFLALEKGQECIFDLSTTIQEYLTNNNSAIRGVRQTSIHELWADRKEKLEQAEQEKTVKKIEELQQEEEALEQIANTALALKVQEEIEKKRAKMVESRLRKGGKMPDQPVLWHIHEKNLLGKLSKGQFISNNIYGSYFTVDPNPASLSDESISDVFTAGGGGVMLQVPFPHSKRGGEETENVYNQLKNEIRLCCEVPEHKNVVRTLDARIVDGEDERILEVLMDCSGRASSLRELVQRAGSIRLKDATAYLKKLIAAVAHLQSLNVIHGDIRVDNVIIDGDPPEVKLCNSIFGRKLLGMIPWSPEVDANSHWEPPELRQSRKALTPKTDKVPAIRRKSVITQQMTFLLLVLSGFDPIPLDAAQRDDVPQAVTSFLSETLNPKPDRRPSPSDLLKHELFASNRTRSAWGGGNLGGLGIGGGGLGGGADHFVVPARTLGGGGLAGGGGLRGFGGDGLGGAGGERGMKIGHAFQGGVEPTSYTYGTSPTMMFAAARSRYVNDFEELEFLGKGGFGEVVKARNRIDGRLYAIKKVHLSSRNKNKDKLLREVLALSRLHHQFVVRYFAAWVEEADGRKSSSHRSDSDVFTSELDTESEEESSTESASTTSSSAESDEDEEEDDFA
ncbi:hypothetical protein HK102_001374, partial [Quaeritorhiza haematococci]